MVIGYIYICIYTLSIYPYLIMELHSQTRSIYLHLGHWWKMLVNRPRKKEHIFSNVPLRLVPSSYKILDNQHELWKVPP